MVLCAIFPEDHKSKVHWPRESLNFEPLVFNSSFLTHWLWVICNGQSLGKSHCLLADLLTMVLLRSSNGKVELVLLPNFPVLHCVKSVQIRSFFYSLNLRTQSECGKIRTRKKLRTWILFNTFHIVLVWARTSFVVLYIGLFWATFISCCFRSCASSFSTYFFFFF